MAMKATVSDVRAPYFLVAALAPRAGLWIKDISLGHFTAFGEPVLFLALSLIIMGVGFLKANISSVVGQLYPQGDPRRDSGFTLYYYGINLGAFWAAVLCGLLGQNVGWWAGFGLAGVGMALGWVVFVIGKPLLQGKGEPPNPELLKQSVAGPVNREWLIYILGVLAVIPVWLLVQRNNLVGIGLALSTVVSLAYIAWFIVRKCDKIERERMMASRETNGLIDCISGTRAGSVLSTS